MKYVKRPIEIDAWQFTKQNFKKGVPRWIDHLPRNQNGREELNPNVSLWSQYGGDIIGGTITLPYGGDVLVSEGDYIIRDSHGNIHPCEPDFFHENYEPVE